MNELVDYPQRAVVRAAITRVMAEMGVRITPARVTEIEAAFMAAYITADDDTEPRDAGIDAASDQINSHRRSPLTA